MKAINILLVAGIFLVACSSPKKTATKPVTPPVTKMDIIRGGTSFSNAVVIMVEKESSGLTEEYKWLSNNYPGYGLIRRTQAQRSARHYDIVRIKTREGYVKNIYFDSTHFFGKN